MTEHIETGFRTDGIIILRLQGVDEDELQGLVQMINLGYASHLEDYDIRAAIGDEIRGES